MIVGMAIVIFMPLALAGLLIFARLVRLEYTSFRSCWEKDGMPYVPFFFPWKECNPYFHPIRFHTSWCAGQRVQFTWLFRTPTWMQGHKQPLRLLWWYRILVIGTIALLLPALAAQLFIFGG